MPNARPYATFLFFDLYKPQGELRWPQGQVCFSVITLYQIKIERCGFHHCIGLDYTNWLIWNLTLTWPQAGSFFGYNLTCSPIIFFDASWREKHNGKSVLLYRGYIKSYFEEADSANFRKLQIQWLLLSNAWYDILWRKSRFGNYDAYIITIILNNFITMFLG